MSAAAVVQENREQEINSAPGSQVLGTLSPFRSIEVASINGDQAIQTLQTALSGVITQFYVREFPNHLHELREFDRQVDRFGADLALARPTIGEQSPFRPVVTALSDFFQKRHSELLLLRRSLGESLTQGAQVTLAQLCDTKESELGLSDHKKEAVCRAVQAVKDGFAEWIRRHGGDLAGVALVEEAIKSIQTVYSQQQGVLNAQDTCLQDGHVLQRRLCLAHKNNWISLITEGIARSDKSLPGIAEAVLRVPEEMKQIWPYLSQVAPRASDSVAYLNRHVQSSPQTTSWVLVRKLACRSEFTGFNRLEATRAQIVSEQEEATDALKGAVSRGTRAGAEALAKLENLVRDIKRVESIAQRALTLLTQEFDYTGRGSQSPATPTDIGGAGQKDMRSLVDRLVVEYLKMHNEIRLPDQKHDSALFAKFDILEGYAASGILGRVVTEPFEKGAIWAHSWRSHDSYLDARTGGNGTFFSFAGGAG